MRLNLLERRLVDPHTTVIIPLDDRVIFVGLLNCAEFSSRLSEVAQSPEAAKLLKEWLLREDSNPRENVNTTT